MSATEATVLLLFAINTLFACDMLSQYDSLTNVVEPVPFEALGVCWGLQFNGTNYSIIDQCDQSYLWSDTVNCVGTPFWSGAVDTESVSECDGRQCQYAMLRMYSSTSCENYGDYIDHPYPINYCLKNKLTNSNDNCYISARCNGSTVAMYIYAFSDCSGDPVFKSNPIFQHGVCNSYNHYTEILYCDYDDPLSDEISILIQLIWIAAYFSLSLSYLIISVWIAWKIFSNLYEFENYKIQFSDKHNWIVEPSSSNKVYALLSVLSYSCHFAAFLVLLVLPRSMDASYDYIRYGLTFIPNIGDICFRLYIISTLEYYIKSNEYMSVMISKCFMKFMYCWICFGALQTIIETIVDISVFKFEDSFDEFYDFRLISGMITLIRSLITELSFLYLYYCGLNNFCHYWYAKQWKEYDKYGENERTHEILITMTRTAVIIVAVVIIGIILPVITVVFIYFDSVNFLLYTIGYEIIWIVAGICFIARSLSVYFIYPFGHQDYEKLCCYYHHKMYNYFKRRHQMQVVNGGFDSDKQRYVSNNKKNRCCLRYNKVSNVEIELSDLLNNE